MGLPFSMPRCLTPPWTWHEHANENSKEAILFSVQDTPIFQALGLDREQALEANDGLSGHRATVPHEGALSAWSQGTAR